MSEEDVIKIVEKFTEGNYLLSRTQVVMIAEDIIKLHEEAMKERAWEVWQSSTFSYDLSYDGEAKARLSFETQYKEILYDRWLGSSISTDDDEYWERYLFDEWYAKTFGKRA